MRHKTPLAPINPSGESIALATLRTAHAQEVAAGRHESATDLKSAIDRLVATSTTSTARGASTHPATSAPAANPEHQADHTDHAVADS